MKTQLTNHQQDQITVYYNKFLNKGLDCNNLSQKEQRDIIYMLYDKCKYPKPVILFMNSPLGSQILANIVDNIRDNIGDNIRDNIRANIVANIWDNIRDNIGANIVANIRDNIVDNIWDNIRANIVANIRDNIRDNIVDNIGDNKSLKIYDTWYGQHNSNWAGYHAYFHDVFKMSVSDEQYYNCFIDLCDLHWFIPFQNICIISQKPLFIKQDSTNRLHADLTPCIQYQDEWSLYYLHGVQMPQEIVLTKAELLQPKQIMQLQNAEQRAQAIKKMGIQKLEKNMTKKDEVTGDNPYILFDMGKLINNELYQPVLKMKNPSLSNHYHFEFVDPVCQTVQQALNWRYSKDVTKEWKPIFIS